mmetsp:Transcript_19901/g.28795  ORF Transcript_19901/g.28795 Transcript_19901/m.28795 type:complete len:229 (-) Transcript_19901:179-865(-)
MGRVGLVHSTSCNNHVGSGCCSLVNRGWAQTSIHLYVEVRESLPQLCHFGHHIHHERLATKSWLHGHDQHQVQVRHEGQHALHRGPGLQGQPHLHARRLHRPDRLRVLPLRLHVEREAVRPRLRHVLHPLVWVGDHEVHVQEGWAGHLLAQAGNHRGPKGEVRDKVPVHHIQVHRICPGIQNPLALLCQSGQVTGQNTGRNICRAGMFESCYRHLLCHCAAVDASRTV